MKEVLQYELGPLPWSLATGDGSIAKTQKSKVLDVLKKIGSSCDNAIPPHTAVTLDAMAMLQSLVHPAATFGGLAEEVFSMFKCICKILVREYILLSTSTVNSPSRLDKGTKEVTPKVRSGFVSYRLANGHPHSGKSSWLIRTTRWTCYGFWLRNGLLENTFPML